MNAPFTQASRLGRLFTALGKDVLVLLRFEGGDHVNDLFEYRIEALSTEPNLDFDKLIGTHASIEIDSQAHGVRSFDGIVTEARWAGVGENGNRYALTLRPWIWIAGLRRNQRIFHNQTVVQILQDLLKPYQNLGDPALKLSLTGSYPVLEYTVQYRESDLAFATRLMERFGISYHFTHVTGSHTMVLTDAVDSHTPVPGKERPYKPAVGAAQTREEHFWEWHPERRMTTGAVRLTEWNFKTPTAAMEVDQTGDAAYARGQTESFDWPGDYLKQDQGKGVVRLRTAQERGQDIRHRAVGDCTSLGAGMTLTLTGDQVNGVKGAQYLCLSARHAFTSDAYGSGGAGADEVAYSGEYVLMPVTAPLAPERKTRVPVVHGPQTAVVVGAGEIDCDEYGRILVHFPWDLAKAHSMRCRVSQNWAGKGWGGMVIPRIGMEVVVEFLEGDPDKPLVTGCVYNGKNDVPYPLPEHKTRSTFKTDTHQGTGFNELRFEDANGIEEIRVIAQKDLNTLVQNSEARIVMNDQATAVFDNRLLEVFGNQISSVSGSFTTYVGATGAMGLAAQGMGAQRNMLSGLAYALDRPNLKENGSPGDYTLITDGSYELTVGQSQVSHVSQNSHQSVGGNYATNVDRNRSARVGGDDSTHVHKTKTEVVGDRYVIICGASRIEMHSSGRVLIRGSDIVFEGSSSITGTAPNIDLN